MHLTEHAAAQQNADTVDSSTVGAPANEIEITPAMLAAGVAGLPQGDEDFNSEFVTQEEIVARIYRAMVITQKAGVQNGAPPDAC